MTTRKVMAPLLLGMGWFPDQLGGLNRYFRDLAHALASRGLDVASVVVGPVADPSFAGLAAGSPTAPLPIRLWRFSRAVARAGDGADLIDAHFALYALVPSLLGRWRSLPLVVHFQGPWADESRSAGGGRLASTVQRRIERTVYRRARETVVLSGAFKRILVERYHMAPWAITIIPPGVDLEHFRPSCRVDARARLQLPPQAWVGLTVRRLVPRMGIDVLLEAWACLPTQRRERVLLIAGDGPARDDLEALAERLGIAESVRFLGRLDEAGLRACYQAADATVVPSTAWEGFGLVVLESLACGVPVVASDVGGLPEALAALDPALIVPAGDVEALAARLATAIDGSGPLPSAERCRAHAEQFSWETVAARHAELYQRVLRAPASRRPRVVYLDHCAGLSGGELALARLLPALEEVDVHVVLAEDGPLVPRLMRRGVSVEVLPMAAAGRALHRDRVRPSKLPLRAACDFVVHVWRLVRRLRQLQPDLIHTNSLKAALYGGVAAKLAGVPVVWHIRDRISDDYLPKEAVTLVRAMARRVPNAMIANSEATAATLPHLPRVHRRAVVSDAAWPGGLTAVIPSPVAVRRLRREQGSPFALRVGMVGRIAPWKGQHVFLEAFARAFPDGTARGLVIGSPLFGEDGYEQELKELLVRLGLEERVQLVGFVDDVEALIGTLDVLVHASVIPEPFGQVVVEGMVAGLAVVAADAGGPAEIIQHGVTGMLYPPGDTRALAEILSDLAGDRAKRLRLGEAARSKGEEFSPEAIARQVMGVYRGVLGVAQR